MTHDPTSSTDTLSMRLLRHPSTLLKGALYGVMAVFLGLNALLASISHHGTPKPAQIDYWQDDDVVNRLLAIQNDLGAEDAAASASERIDAIMSLHHAAPLERRVLYLLISALNQQGREAVSQTVTSIAATLSLRDGPFRSVLTEHLVEKGRYEEAARSYEAMLRTFPDQKPLLLTIMANRSSDEGVRTAVTERLLSSPPWRRDYLLILRDFYQDENIYFDLIEKLRASGSVLSSREYGDYLLGLVKWRNPVAAYDSWVEYNRQRDIHVAYGLFDGTFAFEPDNHPFGWNITSVKNVVKTFHRGEGSPQDRELTLRFIGDRTARPGVEQWLALRPGRHTFAGESSTDGLQAERGLIWRIYCRNGDGNWRALASTKGDVGSHVWLPFSTDFLIPEEDCALQLLRLEAGSYAALDTVIMGNASYRRLSIRKQQ